MFRLYIYLNSYLLNFLSVNSLIVAYSYKCNAMQLKFEERFTCNYNSGKTLTLFTFLLHYQCIKYVALARYIFTLKIFYIKIRFVNFFLHQTRIFLNDSISIIESLLLRYKISCLSRYPTPQSTDVIFIQFKQLNAT